MESTLLWRFNKTDDHSCNYLFGTMHIGSKDGIRHAEQVLPYISQCNAYAAEMDLDVLFGTEMIQHFRLPENQNLKSLFPIEKYNKYRILAQKHYHIDIESFGEFNPFFIVNLLTQRKLSQAGLDTVDKMLWDYALTENKQMYGVESPADQISYLQRVPLEYQIQNFRKVIQNITLFNKQIQALHDLYAKRALSELYKRTQRSLGSLRNMLLYERNEKMTISIIDISSSQPTFFAVGAAHLPGHKGILRLLKKSGYKIEPVFPVS